MIDFFLEGGDVFYKFSPFRGNGLNKEKLFTDMKNLCMKIREGRKRMAKTLVGRLVSKAKKLLFAIFFNALLLNTARSDRRAYTSFLADLHV